MIREAITNIEETTLININEAGAAIIKLAKNSGADNTKELREKVDKEVKINNSGTIIDSNGMPALYNSKSISTLNEMVKVYNKLLDNNKSTMKKIFDLTFGNEFGKGEVLMAYLHEDISVGGPGQSFDLSLNGNDEAEVKNVLKKGSLWGNFRLGTESDPIMSQCIRHYSDLWEVARLFVKELNTTKMIKDAKSNKFDNTKDFLREWDISIAKDMMKMNIDIRKNGNVYFNDVIVGSIVKDEQKAINVIKDIINTDNSTHIKSYTEIEELLSDGLSSHDRSYIFFKGQKNGDLTGHYKKRMPVSKIESITQGKFKVKIKL